MGLLQHCKYIDNCYTLYNDGNHPEWAIGNEYGTQHMQYGDLYNYKYQEFLLALGALSDRCQARVRTVSDLREKCYHTSTFKNSNNTDKGHVKTFSEDPGSIDRTIVEQLEGDRYTVEKLSFIETRLLLDCSKGNKKLKLTKVELNKQLLPLYKRDQAIMMLLAHVPALGQANKDGIDQVSNQTDQLSSNQANMDNVDAAHINITAEASGPVNPSA